MAFTKNQNILEVEDATDTDVKSLIEKAKHFAPAYDRILIKRELSALERKTKKAGIIMADQTKDAYQSAEGYLVGYGPGVCDEAKALLGKRILFSKYTGDDIVVPLPDGTKEQFILASHKDIYGELK